jgi:hypothetical protein
MGTTLMGWRRGRQMTQPAKRDHHVVINSAAARLASGRADARLEYRGRRGAGGVSRQSVALADFGLDSLIARLASLVVVWQLAGANKTHEWRTLRLIGIAFLALAISILGQLLVTVLTLTHPAPSTLAITWLCATLLAVLALAYAKRLTGRQLGNRALTTAARVTLIDAYLATVLLGLAANARFGWCWADPLVGLVIVSYALRGGWEALHVSRHSDRYDWVSRQPQHRPLPAGSARRAAHAGLDGQRSRALDWRRRRGAQFAACSSWPRKRYRTDHPIDTPHGFSRGILATGGELVWGVAPHECRNHLTRWTCPAPCDLSVLPGGGMVGGASHEGTASLAFLAPGERTERVWYESS